MFHLCKKAYKGKKEKISAFSLFQSGFRRLMELIRKYWTWKVKKKQCEFIVSTHPVQKSALLIINFNIPLET